MTAIVDSKNYFSSNEACDYFDRETALFPKERIAFGYIPRDSTVLDLGCGTGRTTRHLAKAVDRVVGVDISAAMVAKAKAVGDGTPYFIGDACALGFSDRRFDAVVFSYNGLDYIYPYEYRIKALHEIKRVLKPGGLFIFSTHNCCIPRDLAGVVPFLGSLGRKDRSTYIVDTAYSWGKTPVYVTTPKDQIEVLERHGFRLQRLVTRRALRWVRSLKLLGWLDLYCYYVAISGECAAKV